MTDKVALKVVCMFVINILLRECIVADLKDEQKVTTNDDADLSDQSELDKGMFFKDRRMGLERVGSLSLPYGPEYFRRTSSRSCGFV